MSDIRNCYARQLEEALRLQEEIRKELRALVLKRSKAKDKVDRATYTALINKCYFQYKKLDRFLDQLDEEAANVPW